MRTAVRCAFERFRRVFHRPRNAIAARRASLRLAGRRSETGATFTGLSVLICRGSRGPGGVARSAVSSFCLFCASFGFSMSDLSSLALTHVAKLHAYTPGLQPTEAGWVKLNTNECPYPPSPRVAEALHEAIGPDAASLRLYPNPASAPVRADRKSTRLNSSH